MTGVLLVVTRLLDPARLSGLGEGLLQLGLLDPELAGDVSSRELGLIEAASGLDQLFRCDRQGDQTTRTLSARGPLSPDPAS